MKVLAILSAILAGAASYPVVKTWSLSQLSDAIEHDREPALKPYLEYALNEIMLGMLSDDNIMLFYIAIPSPSGSAEWTFDELKSALKDRDIKGEKRELILEAYRTMNNSPGNLHDTIPVIFTGMDISIWTRADLDEALASPSTKPELMPYLEKAYNELKESEDNGIPKETVGMATPFGLIPYKTEFIPIASELHQEDEDRFID